MLRFAAGFLLLASPLLAEPQFVPVGNLQLSGGQYFFRGKNTDLGGNFAATLSPSLVLSDKTSIIPTYHVNYRGVRTVEELAGGGFLTQEVLDFYASLKYTRRLGSSPWTLKPFASFKLEFINETTDESLGSGLFDWWKHSAGLELEREGERFKSQRFLLSYYGTRFPNYRSLASTSQFGSELNAGTKVLDFSAFDLSYAADVLLSERLLAYGAALGSHRPYGDQNIVTSAGTFQNKKRTDLYWTAGTGLHYALGQYRVFGAPVKVFKGLGVSYTRLDSDQNSFDAARTNFTPKYYNYADMAVTPSLDLQIGKRQKFSTGFSYVLREYDERLVQDLDGNYHDGNTAPREKIKQNLRTVYLNYSYLLSEESWGNLNATFQGSYRKAKSNMLYETTYRYNYESSHYFAGLSLDFGG